MGGQPPLSFSISAPPLSNGGGATTSNVGQETQQPEPISMKTIIALATILIANLSVGQSEPTTDKEEIAVQSKIIPAARIRAGLKALNLLPDNEKKILYGDPLQQTIGTKNRPAGTIIQPVKPDPEVPIEVYFWKNSYGQYMMDFLVNGEPKNVDMLVPEDEQDKAPQSGVADPKAALAAIDSKIALQRKRWIDATAVINKLTNFKKSPVQEGTQAYYKCLEASKIIQEVEAGAEALKQEKSRLEDQLKKLPGNNESPRQ